MKKSLLFSLALALSATFVHAQSCMPDFNLPDSVIISPLPFNSMTGMGGITDTACVNQPYETVLQFQIPNTIMLFGNTVGLISVDVPTTNGLVNAPAGLSYTCNPPDCVFKADSVGCISLFGTTTAAPGVYDLKISTTIRTSFLPIQLQLPDGTVVTGNYFLHVKPEGACEATSSTDSRALPLTLKNQPNPFASHTDIIVSAGISGQFDFVVRDLLGRQVHRSAVQLQIGDNTVGFDGSQLPNGMYLYSFGMGAAAVSGKMMISRR